MWWRSCSNRRDSSSDFWIVALVIFGVAIFATNSFAPFWPLLIVIFVVLPLAGRRSRRRAARYGCDDFEKPKYVFDEKPKRDAEHDPRYLESEDGTLLEVIEEKPDDTQYR